MNINILALVVAMAVPFNSQGSQLTPQQVQELCTPSKPPAKKVVKKKKKKVAQKQVVKKEEPPKPTPTVDVTCVGPATVQVTDGPVNVVVTELPPPPPKVEVKVVTVREPVLPPKKPLPERSDVEIGFHMALGVGVLNPDNDLGAVSGFGGFRFHHLPTHLGAEAVFALDKGVGLEGMYYTYETDDLSHHVDLGFLFSGPFNKLSVGDVPRNYDLTFGTGLDIPLNTEVDLTLDLKWRFPDPIFVATHAGPVYKDGQQVYGEEGKYLDVPHVLGNSLGQTQLFIGLNFK